MNLHGKNFIGDRLSSGSEETFYAANPADNSILQPKFHAAGEADVNAAMESAETAFETYRETTGEQCDIHAYLKTPHEVIRISGSPLLEIQSGQGWLLASEMCFESAKDDPIARRLLMNSISYLQDKH